MRARLESVVEVVRDSRRPWSFCSSRCEKVRAWRKLLGRVESIDQLLAERGLAPGQPSLPGRDLLPLLRRPFTYGARRRTGVRLLENLRLRLTRSRGSGSSSVLRCRGSVDVSIGWREVDLGLVIWHGVGEGAGVCVPDDRWAAL